MRQLSAKSPLERLPPAYNYVMYRPSPFSDVVGCSARLENGAMASPMTKGSASALMSGDTSERSSKPSPVAFKHNRFIWNRKTLDSTFLSAASSTNGEATVHNGGFHMWDESRPETSFPLTKSPTVNDIPLPRCIVRHLQHPHPLLLSPTSKLSAITSLALNAAASAGGSERSAVGGNAAIVTLPTKVRGFRVDVRGRKGPRSLVQVIKYGKLGLKRFSTDYVDFGKSYYLHKLGITGVKAWVAYER